MDMNPASKKVTPSAAIPPPVASAMLPGPTAGVEREYRCYDTALMYSPLPWVARTLRSSFPRGAASRMVGGIFMKRTISILFFVGTALFGLVPVRAAAQEVPTADMAIVSNTANVKHAHVGQQVSFTIVAINNGPDLVEVLAVTYTSVQNLQPVDEICDLGISADSPSCEYSTVQPGQARTTIVVAEIVDTGAKIASLTACVTALDPTNDPNGANNCATATLKIVGKR